MRLLSALLLIAALHPQQRAAEPLSVSSPDGSIVVTIGTSGGLTYAVSVDGRDIISPSRIGMTLRGGEVLGAAPVVLRSDARQEDRVLRPVVRIKREQIVDRYRELRIDFKGDYALVVRAYDDGIAYRFVLAKPGEIVVESEQATFDFGGNPAMVFPEDTSFISHQERPYRRVRFGELKQGAFAYPPVLVAPEGGPKFAITEADLLDYSGMSLAVAGSGLAGLFPAYPATTEMVRDRTERVPTREPWIAKTRGTRAFPWRVVSVARQDADLLSTDIVYRLASDAAFGDPSWIRPGQVAWDWWNFNNLYGVKFRAGVNTETYKHYIDFAAENGIEYVILDEGWYKLGDLLSVVPEMDMNAIAAHARAKNVGLIMWVVWKTLDQQMEAALDQFERWGVKGIKVDFMQRDDQWMVNFYERVAKEAARRHLLVDFHGAYKPTGLYRTYPNVLTSEGIQGLEQSKWSTFASPDHDVTFPFLRMMAGPVDYTPGGMLNATKADFQPIFNRPMTQGTRCHQLAMYVLYESPLQMLADSPSNYRREPESLAFIANVPVTWDETRVLDARVGEYIVTARRHGADWYIGAMTNWSRRRLDVNLDFLDGDAWRAEIFRDGPNADRAAVDYVREQRTVRAGERLQLQLAPGGGWAARITRSNAR